MTDGGNDLHSYCMKIDNFENEVRGWEKVFESDTTRIFRQEQTDLMTYKVLSFMENVEPRVCYRVYMDIEYRKTWDAYVKELYAFQENGEDCIYWEVKYPLPASNRDYTYKMQVAEEDCNGAHMYVIHCQSFKSQKIPARRGVVRVEEYKQVVVISASKEASMHGTIVYMEYTDDPSGSLPDWLINWAAKRGAPNFLTATQMAIQRYSQYLENR